MVEFAVFILLAAEEEELAMDSLFSPRTGEPFGSIGVGLSE
jgi:hypothetical protein